MYKIKSMNSFSTGLFIRADHKISIISRSFRTSQLAYTKLIEIYTHDRALHSGKVLHAHLIITGLARLTHFASKLIALYTECRKILYARKLFDKIPKTNIHRWIALIGAYARRGYHQEALDVFHEMQGQSLKPNKFVIPSVLKACGNLLDVGTGLKIHCVVVKHSFETDAFVTSALIDMYSKCGYVEAAKKVFNGMVEKDIVAMNALVSGYVQHELASEALSLVEEMEILGVTPNVVTWNSLIAGFSQKGDQVMVSKLFGLMHNNGVEPDVVSWTSVISGLVQNFCNDQAFDMFKQMLGMGFYPSSATISSILAACASVANVKRGKEIHGNAVVTGVEDDIYVRSALVDMYAKCGFISQARALFSKMSERNTVTWNSMIFGYANHGYCNEAIELFNKMQEKQKLDHLTFTAVLTACSHAGLVELGQSLFSEMQENYKIKPRLEHFACMVDLLGRAGRIAEAYDFIKTMPTEPDIFVWGALLGACKNHGNIELAEVAAKHLAELEPGSVANKLLLTDLYANAGNWSNVTRLKKMLKKRKLKKFPGCSWIEAD
ncbi:pentatricopeptide repeat-containing protein At5g59600 [Pistacia vera]|uniref:pentatricopeptide repeat-containing protein At5g59600 n=1 Tax=Pistacia vera TaxID=55513 RepID=UPI001262B9B2|nr:pentatricopeptide repeat-containing protein At5g59600 [Pistacia vera]